MGDDSGLLRLNLGCGQDIRPGYVNHDWSRHRPDVEVAHDLEAFPWPWPDNSAEEIVLSDVLEHLADVVPVIDQCWRILTPAGFLHISVPHYQHENAWLDPTHRRPFHLDTFDYFDPETELGSKYCFYTDRKWCIQEKKLAEDGNVVVYMRPRKGQLAPPPWSRRTGQPSPDELFLADAQLLAAELSALVVEGERCILVDDNQLGQTLRSLRPIPFLEHDGDFWGPPPDDFTAIRELQRLRKAGASFIVFAFPAFWWLNYFSAFVGYLRQNFPCAARNERLVAFDLRPPP